MSYRYLPEYAKAAVHAEHERRVDYYYGFAGELLEGDGLRLLPLPGKGVPIELVQSLIAAKVERMGDLVAITVSERAEFINEVVYGVSAPTHTTVVYSADDPILIRY